MKKLYTLLLLSSLSYAQVSLPHYDGFDYTAGEALQTQTGWVAVNTGDNIDIVSGNLSFTNLMTSTGNKISFAGAGIDASKAMVSQNSGTIYYSLLINPITMAGVTDVNGGYLAGFQQNTTTFGATLWTKRVDDDNLNFGIEVRTATGASTTWTGNYPANTTYFLVVSYTFVDGTNNDEVKLWVNPTPGASEPASTITDNHTGTDLPSIVGFFIRQDSATETPSVEIDELRIGTTWADVTPEAAASLNDNNISGLKMYPNPLKGNTLFLTSTANANMSVQIFDVLGKEVLKSNVINNTVNVAGLNAGVYIVKITEEGKTATRKLVIQ
jgi:hypothetical protein